MAKIIETMDGEEWREVPGLPGYFASSFGRLKGPYGKILKAQIDKWIGHRLCVRVSLGGKTKNYRVHHLVALTFHGPRPPGLVVDHIDENCLNNCANNLQYITQKENQAKSAQLRKSLKRLSVTARNARKVVCKRGHILASDNLRQTPLGRSCKECARQRWREYRWRKIAEGTWKRT